MRWLWPMKGFALLLWAVDSRRAGPLRYWMAADSERKVPLNSETKFLQALMAGGILIQASDGYS